MANTFELEIVTPEKMIVRDVAEEVQIPGKNGYLGILPQHAPLISELAVGEITYRNAHITHCLAVAWGFVEVLPDRVTILAEAAERAEDVDVGQAEAAKVQAESRLLAGATEKDFAHAIADLKHAETRLAVARKKR